MSSFHNARWSHLLLPALLILSTLPSSLVVRAQTALTPVPAPSAPTLEMVMLAVDHVHRPVDDVSLDKLKLKAGAGAPFAALAMRREGDDPISLAILIDASRDSFHDLSKVGDEFASLVGSQLLPQDRISLYVADCAMTRALNNQAPDAAGLKKAVTDAFNFPTLHGGQSHSACGKTFHLWDDVAVAVAGLSHASGRRVLLLISSGADGGSKYDWMTVEQYAFDQGVAVFGLRDKRQADADNFSRNSLTTTHGTPGATVSFAPPPSTRSANSLELLCANDGGLTLSSAPEFRKDGIADILFLIRSRFVLTIPKDAYQPGTTHGVKITQTPLTPYFMTATGALEAGPK